MRACEVAVIGARGIGASHVAALRQIPGAQVSLIVGSTPETAQAAARSLDVPRWSVDWTDAITDDAISAVHICVPNNLHFPIVSAALAAGKHVVCEKPLCVDGSEARRLVDLARTYPDQFSVLGYKYRYAPLVRALARHVQDGTLGRVHDVRGSYRQNWMLDPEQSSWRRDADRGGRRRVLLDIGTHLFDLMETVLGRRLIGLQGQFFSANTVNADAGLDDGAHLLLQFAEDTRGIASLSQVSAADTHRISVTVDGTRGSARWTLGDVETLDLFDAANTARLCLDGNTMHSSGGRYWRRGAEPDRLLVPLLADAYAQGDAAVPTPTFEDGCRHVELIEALAPVASAELTSGTVG